MGISPYRRSDMCEGFPRSTFSDTPLDSAWRRRAQPSPAPLRSTARPGRPWNRSWRCSRRCRRPRTAQTWSRGRRGGAFAAPSLPGYKQRRWPRLLEASPRHPATAGWRWAATWSAICSWRRRSGVWSASPREARAIAGKTRPRRFVFGPRLTKWGSRRVASLGRGGTLMGGPGDWGGGARLPGGGSPRVRSSHRAEGRRGTEDASVCRKTIQRNPLRWPLSGVPRYLLWACRCHCWFLSSQWHPQHCWKVRLRFMLLKIKKWSHLSQF